MCLQPSSCCLNVYCVILSVDADMKTNKNKMLLGLMQLNKAAVCHCGRASGVDKNRWQRLASTQRSLFVLVKFYDHFSVRKRVIAEQYTDLSTGQSVPR